MVRRATFLAADVPDETDYLCNNLTGTNLQNLIDARRGDIEAVRYASKRASIQARLTPIHGPSTTVSTEQLVQRGLNELRLLDLR